MGGGDGDCGEGSLTQHISSTDDKDEDGDGDEVSVQAMALLRHICMVEGWVKAGDPRAQPYLDAGAVRLIDGGVGFNPERFDRVMREQGS